MSPQPGAKTALRGMSALMVTVLPAEVLILGAKNARSMNLIKSIFAFPVLTDILSATHSVSYVNKIAKNA